MLRLHGFDYEKRLRINGQEQNKSPGLGVFVAVYRHAVVDPLWFTQVVDYSMGLILDAKRHSFSNSLGGMNLPCQCHVIVAELICLISSRLV